MSLSQLPLRPIEADLVSVLERAVSQRELTREIAAEARRRGVNRVVFVGVGGSWASSVPIAVQLAAAGGSPSVENVNARDFTDIYLNGITAQTLVLATSHSGGTPETVQAANAAAERGAFVVSLATSENNSLAATADFSLVYGSERTITCAKYLILAELMASIREAYSGWEASAIRAAFDVMPAATLEAVESSSPQLATVAEQFAHEDRTYILASGPQLGLAYMLSVCYLVEMQGKHTTHLASADFFHGPFEIAVNRQPYVLLQGEDGTRAQATRVRRFLDRYDSNYAVLDTGDLALEGVTKAHRGVVGHIAQAAIVQRLAEHFEPLTGRNLDDRRYMHKVDY